VRYILSALCDFKLLGEPHGDRRPVLPFNLARFTTIYLAHELHFAGLSGSQILVHTDW
jgi:hypothetical protein